MESSFSKMIQSFNYRRYAFKPLKYASKLPFDNLYSMRLKHDSYHKMQKIRRINYANKATVKTPLCDRIRIGWNLSENKWTTTQQQCLIRVVNSDWIIFVCHAASMPMILGWSILVEYSAVEQQQYIAHGWICLNQSD